MRLAKAEIRHKTQASEQRLRRRTFVVMLKIWPVLALNLVALAILEDR